MAAPHLKNIPRSSIFIWDDTAKDFVAWEGALGTSSSIIGKVKLVDSSGVALDMTDGGQTGVKVMVVGDGDKYVKGTIAHDAVATAVEPVLEGGYASAAAPTDVSADGDAVRGWNLRNGARAVQLTHSGTLVSPLTDTQLRATAVPISGTVTANLGTIAGVATETTLALIKNTDGIKKITDALPAGTNLIGDVTIQPRTTGGLSVANFTSGDGSTALTSTAQVISANPGQLYGWYIFNPNAVTAWVILYNVAAASVTVGTTNPLIVLGIPAGSAANVVNPLGIAFGTAMSCAAVMTAANGNTAPTVALDAMIFYK